MIEEALAKRSTIFPIILGPLLDDEIEYAPVGA